MSMTPLGSPVVPLEYGSATRSVPRSSSGVGAASARSANSANEVAAVPDPKVKISFTVAPRAASVATSSRAGTVRMNLAPESRSCRPSSSVV